MTQTSPTPILQEKAEKPKEKLRAYNIDGHVYPSVTSVLSFTFGMPQEMATWIARNASLRALREQRAAIKRGEKPTQKWLVEQALTERHRLLKESQVKGTTLHTWAEQFYNTGGKFIPEPLPKEYLGYWNSFLKFNTYYNVQPIVQEMVVHSHEYKYAGRMDFYGTLHQEGKVTRVLVDFKTSNFLSWHYGLQLAAYKFALETMGYPVDECYILHLRSGGYYEFVKFDFSFKHFISVRELFSLKKDSEQPEFELAWTPEEAVEKFKKEAAV